MSVSPLHPIKLHTRVSHISGVKALDYLREQHESVVCSQVLLKELYAVGLQRWHCVLLGSIQGGHHRLRADLYLIRVQKPAGCQKGLERTRESR